MVNHPTKCPRNAVCKNDALIAPHREYSNLDNKAAGRQSNYRHLFRACIPNMTLKTIREATNKGWVLGDEKFKTSLEKKLNRRSTSTGHSGDRKSNAYCQDNQRV